MWSEFGINVSLGHKYSIAQMARLLGFESQEIDGFPAVVSSTANKSQSTTIIRLMHTNPFRLHCLPRTEKTQAILHCWLFTAILPIKGRWSMTAACWTACHIRHRPRLTRPPCFWDESTRSATRAARASQAQTHPRPALRPTPYSFTCNVPTPDECIRSLSLHRLLALRLVTS